MADRMKKICFYTRTKSRILFDIVDFYSNDIKIFRELGYEVVLANSYKNIPTDCDLYFIWWWTSGIVPLLKVKAFIKKPAVMIGNLHYSDPSIQGYKNKPFYIKAFIKYCLRNSDVQIATSEMEYTEIKNLKPRNLKMVYHAIDTSKYFFKPYKSRKPILFTLTHLTRHNVKRKCVIEIVEAFKIVSARYPEYKLYIAGGTDGDGYPEVLGKVESLGIKDNVIFMGRISDVEKIQMYQECSVYVQPTYFEGFGMALAESMACGAPTVTSPKGAVPEVVGDISVFTEPNDVKQIADGIMKYLGDFSFSEEMGIKGRDRIEELFTMVKRKAKISQIIKELI
jgi:glycosyltransferase involved in cell wall biosynthesis